MFGASHEATLEFRCALSELKAKLSSDRNNQSICRLESLLGKMKGKNLIELIDRRKLSRISLHEKSELVRL